MPSKIRAPSLLKCASRSIIKDIHSICISNEVKECKKKRNFLAQLISKTPFSVQQILLYDLIDYLFTVLPKTARTEKMEYYLGLALSPALRIINLNDFFYKIRLSRVLDQTIRRVVNYQVSLMSSLNSFSMEGHCDDVILDTISKHCKEIKLLSFSHSSLVTDEGVRSLTTATSLEEVYCMECPYINPDSIKELIENLPSLRVLHYIDLFRALIHIKKFPGKCENLQMTDFVQIGLCFSATQRELEYLCRILPNVLNVRLYLNETFKMDKLPIFPNLRSIHLETPGLIGRKFNTCFQKLASTITQLGLNCNAISPSQIELIGKECKHLTVLSIMIARINSSQVLVNDGNLFKSLQNLTFQVWQERDIHRSYLEMFVFHSSKLNVLNVKARMPFLDDSFLLEMLRSNPLTDVRQVLFSSDAIIPLTKRSAYHLIENCSEMEHMCVTSWQVDQDEFNEIKNFCGAKNYYFTLT